MILIAAWIVGVALSQLSVFNLFYEETYGLDVSNFSRFSVLLLFNLFLWWFIFPSYIMFVAWNKWR